MLIVLRCFYIGGFFPHLKKPNMKLIHTLEKFTHKNELQVIEITAVVHTLEAAQELGYEDFELNLFINHKFISDISPVLGTTEFYKELVDSIDWVKMYKDEVSNN